MSKLEIQWKRSDIGRKEDQRGTIRALGLRRLGQVVVHEDSPSIRGMVFKVRHLVEVRERTDS